MLFYAFVVLLLAGYLASFDNAAMLKISITTDNSHYFIYFQLVTMFLQSLYLTWCLPSKYSLTVTSSWLMHLPTIIKLMDPGFKFAPYCHRCSQILIVAHILPSLFIITDERMPSSRRFILSTFAIPCCLIGYNKYINKQFDVLGLWQITIFLCLGVRSKIWYTLPLIRTMIYALGTHDYIFCMSFSGIHHDKWVTFMTFSLINFTITLYLPEATRDKSLEMHQEDLMLSEVKSTTSWGSSEYLSGSWRFWEADSHRESLTPEEVAPEDRRTRTIASLFKYVQKHEHPTNHEAPFVFNMKHERCAISKIWKTEIAEQTDVESRVLSSAERRRATVLKVDHLLRCGASELKTTTTQGFDHGKKDTEESLTLPEFCV